MSRPWAVDPTLGEVTEFFIRSPNSMIQRIDHSFELRRIFTEHCNKLEQTIVRRRNNVLMSLHSAKHRFESYAAPMGRWVLWLIAICYTARDVSILRTSSEATCGVLFIEYITTSKAVLQAMLADAADDGHGFVRKDDDFDKSDPAEINSDVYCFLIRVAHIEQTSKHINTQQKKATH